MSIAHVAWLSLEWACLSSCSNLVFQGGLPLTITHAFASCQFMDFELCLCRASWRCLSRIHLTEGLHSTRSCLRYVFNEPALTVCRPTRMSLQSSTRSTVLFPRWRNLESTRRARFLALHGWSIAYCTVWLLPFRENRFRAAKLRGGFRSWHRDRWLSRIHSTGQWVVFVLLTNFQETAQNTFTHIHQHAHTGCQRCWVHIACRLISFWMRVQNNNCVDLRGKFEF